MDISRALETQTYKMIRLRLCGIKATMGLGSCLAGLLLPGDVILLSGDLGAGKTTLVKAIASGLGIDERMVTSPSFAIIHEYRGGRLPFCHADLYRLGDRGDIAETCLVEYMDGKWVVVVEWGEYLDDELKTEALKITLEWLDEEVRDTMIEDGGQWGARLHGLESCIKNTQKKDKD